MADAMYLVFAGSVTVLDHRVQTQRSAMLNSGSWFGEDGLLFDMLWTNTVMADGIANLTVTAQSLFVLPVFVAAENGVFYRLVPSG